MQERIGPWRIVFADTAPRGPLKALLATLEGGEPPAGAETVKKSPVRHVFRAPLADGGSVYVKRCFVRGLRERALLISGNSPARQEFRNLARLRDLDVACVEPLCCAEIRAPGRLEAVLITRGQSDARVLHDCRDELGEDERRSLRQQLARCARRLHDAGLWHRDLHGGNVLVVRSGEGEVRPVLVDVQKLRSLFVSLPMALRAYDLVRLQRSMPARDAGAPLVERYAEAGTPRLDSAGLRRRVDAASTRRVRRRLRSRGRRCVKTSSGFRIERARGVSIYRRADIEQAVVLAALESPGQSLDRTARVVDVLGGPPPGLAADPFARGYGAPEPGAPARAPVAVREIVEVPVLSLLTSRGMAAWRAAHALLLRGFDTPAPLALVRRGRRSYLITRWEDGAESLGDRVGDTTDGAVLVQAAAQLLARLHAGGLVYRQLRPERLLLRAHPAGADADPEFMLTDLELLRVGPRASERARSADLLQLARLIRSRQPHLGAVEVEGLLRGYCDGSDEAEAAWRSLGASIS